MGAHQTTGVDRQLIRGEDPTDTSVSTSVSSDDTSDLSKTATVSLTLVDAPVSGFVNQLHRLSRFVTNAARKLKPGTSPKPVDSSRLSGGQKSTDDHNETFDRCRRLRVLFWKDFVICKWRRHYIKSTLELILPVGILLLVAWSRGYGEQIGGTWEGPDKYPEVNLSALVTLKETGSEIVYSPATNYTDTIVPDAFRNPNSRPVFTGFHTVDMMMQYLESNYSTDVSLAIVFDPETAQVYYSDMRRPYCVIT